MKNIRKVFLAVMIGILIISSMGCSAFKKTESAEKKSPVAKVDGENITKEDLRKRMAPTKASYKQTYGADWEKNSQQKASYVEQEKSMRDTMIDEVLILQHAKKSKVFPSEKKVNDEYKKKYAELCKQQGGESKLVSVVKQYGLTKDEYKDYLKRQVKIQKAIDGLLKDVKIDDAKVKQEYDSNKDIKYTTSPGTIHIQNILVASQADANKVISRLNAGEDFSTVAKEVSIDTANKSSGGDIGDYYIDPDRNESPLDANFVKAAMALKEGVISSPVQTSSGWNIIKVTKRTEYPAKKYDDVKVEIKATLLQTQQKKVLTEALNKWKKDLGKKLKTYDKNLEYN